MLPADTFAPYLQVAPVTKLLQQHSDTLAAPIRPEVVAAISKLPLNKSPGPDGFSTSFYKILHTAHPAPTECI